MAENKFTESSGFGMRWGKLHAGLDYAAPLGTPITAKTGGQVVFSGFGKSGSGFGGYGNAVMIKGDDGRSYLYAHNSKNLVQVGQRIEKGQQIGLVGSTGDSTGNHLHFEVRENGKAIDPKTIGGYDGTGAGGVVPSTGGGGGGFMGNMLTGIVRAALIFFFIILAIVFFMKAFPATDSALRTATSLANPANKIKMAASLAKGGK